jgi:sugar phosphate isomerase/epimerase
LNINRTRAACIFAIVLLCARSSVTVADPPAGAERSAAPGRTATTSTAPALPPPVEGYPIGWCIRARPQPFNDAKSAGFEYVELALQDVLSLSDADFEQLAGLLQSSGVRALSGYNPIPKDLKLVGPDIDPAAQDKHLGRLLSRAATLKLTYVIFNAGAAWRVPDGFAPDRGFDQLTEFSRRFAKAAAEKHLTVLLEPVRSTDSNQITTIGQALRLIDAVDQPNFALMVDYSFLTIQKDDFSALLKSPAALRHVHLSNPAKQRTYPMSDDESDYAAFFAVLKQIKYQGGLSVHGSTTDFAHDAPAAIAFLRGKARQLAAASAPTR